MRYNSAPVPSPSGQNKLTKMPHHCHTWMVQSCSPVGANVHRTCFFGPTGVHIPNSISIGWAVFAQLTTESPCTLQLAAPFHLKIAALHGGSGPPSNTRFLGPNRCRSVQWCLQGSQLWQIDRPTDHATPSVTIGCICVRSAVVLRCGLIIFGRVVAGRASGIKIVGWRWWRWRYWQPQWIGLSVWNLTLVAFGRCLVY